MVNTTRTPWHLWVIGILYLLWSCMGALDYTMTQTRNDAYMSMFTPEQLEYFYGFPSWTVAGWAVGVWFGVIGSILLLLRRALAVPTLVLAFTGTLVSALYIFILAKTPFNEIAGTGEIVFSLVIQFMALLIIWYAWRMRNSGVLR